MTRRSLWAALWLPCLLAVAGTPRAGAQIFRGAPPKPVVPQTLQSPAGTTEVGLLDGAAYRIDIPPDWNHSLVVYYHGYAEHGASFHIAEKIHPDLQQFTDRHYAVIQSAYSRGGWAVEQAFPETETLRHYFEHRYGPSKETYAAGGSMGGALTMITLEINPRPYLGGLDLCGAVGATYESFDRRFAMRAAFDHYFPGALGPLVPVPADYDDTPALREKILNLLKANPDKADRMRALMDLHTDGNVAGDMVYFTFVIADMQKRAGGNPFDNRNWIYQNSSPQTATDYELNDNVRRYGADAKAREYLVRHYTPNGRLGKPMLALHTVYDPFIPASQLATYDHTVQAAGYAENLVQQYVHREGHCAIAPEEIGRAFDELVHWTHGGARPVPGLLK